MAVAIAMEGLFEIDASGDSDLRLKLARVAKPHKLTPKMTAKQKRRRLLEHEKELSELVFQSSADVPDADDEEQPEALDSDDDDARKDGQTNENEEDEKEASSDDEDKDEDEEDEAEAPVLPKAAASLPAAWVDEDDEDQIIDVSGNDKGKSRLRKLRTSRAQTALGGAEYAAKLRQQFSSVNPDVSWAALPDKPARRAKHTRFGGEAAVDAEGVREEEEAGVEEEEEPIDFLRSAEPVFGVSATLPRDVLSVRRMTDLNAQERNASLTQAVEWHPNGKLALTAGPDKTLRLFRTDGADNPKLQSIHLPKLPIQAATFSHDGAQVFMVGRAKHWAVFDLHSGAVHAIPGLAGRTDKAFHTVLACPAGGTLAMLAESGAVLLVSAASKQLIATLQPAGGGSKFATQCGCFSADGEYLYTSGEGSTVRVWDLRRRCCVHTWSDRGGLRVTSLAASPDGAQLAAGSDSGAVNVYRTADAQLQPKPRSLKEYLNLTSAVTTLAYHPSSELLGFASKYTRRAMRVAHVAAGQVFANWPTGRSPLNYVQATAFAPHSGYMAIGNDQGKVLLYQLNHFAGM